MKYEILSGWRGCVIRKPNPAGKFYLYVSTVYKGKYTWITDHAFAKHFSQKTAEKHVAILKQMSADEKVTE